MAAKSFCRESSARTWREREDLWASSSPLASGPDCYLPLRSARAPAPHCPRDGFGRRGIFLCRFRGLAHGGSNGEKAKIKGVIATPVAGVGRGPDIIAGTESAQHSRNAGPGAAGGAGDVRAAPRGIVADELRASRDARRPLGVSWISRGREIRRDQWPCRCG